MLVRIGVAGVLGGGAGAGEFFVTLLGHGENVFDLVSLAGHFIEHELELRSQAQSSLVAHQRTQVTLGLIERLLGALAFAFLVAFVAELGPVDLGDLQIVGHTNFGDGDAGESLVMQFALNGGGDDTLNQGRNTCGARVGSCHRNFLF